jgi:carbamoyl-phosphate synthase large subunit
MSLTDVEVANLRDISLKIMDRVGVAAGGSNVQFAVNPHDGRMVIIEMNPRVSRSSALASKATGFPIAKVAARLAVGYTLPEIMNDATGTTSACFEPSIDYCVVKAPRFAFEKFKDSDDTLSTRMKAVGEVMSIGRTFEEALGKALRSLENGPEKLFLYCRYIRGATVEECAEALGYSRSHMYRIRKRALELAEREARAQKLL